MGKLIETERLFLRVFSPEDLEAAKTFWGDAEVMKESGGAASPEVLPVILDGYRKCHDERGLSVYAVVEKSSGTVIGAAGFNIAYSVQDIELIYHFSRASWGKGYATEAAKACLELAQTHGNVKKLHASADPENQNSTKILEKIGFIYQGMKWFDDTNQEEPYYEFDIVKDIV